MYICLYFLKNEKFLLFVILYFPLKQGGSKIQEAYLIFQDFSEKYQMTSLILNGKAVCCMHMGNFDEAETLLLEALNKASFWLVDTQHFGFCGLLNEWTSISFLFYFVSHLEKYHNLSNSQYFVDFSWLKGNRKKKKTIELTLCFLNVSSFSCFYFLESLKIPLL